MYSSETASDLPIFVDRTDEFRIITSRIETSASPEVLLLSGKSGWGKSALAAKCLRAVGGRVAVDVEIPHAFEALDADLVKSMLASGLSAVGERTGNIPTFDEFLIGREGIEVAREAAKTLAGSIIKKYLGDDAFDVLKKVGASVALRATKGVSQGLSDEVSAYVAECLRTVPISLRIENLQSMTPKAVEFLARTLADSSGVYAIAEFTDDASVIATDAELGKHIFEEYGLKPATFPLDVLPFDELCTAYKDRPAELIELLRSSYYRAKGNLHPVRQLEVVYRGDPLALRDLAPDAEAVWRTLGNNEKMIAALVAAHGSDVEREMLHALLASDGVADRLFLGLLDPGASLSRLAEMLFVRDAPTVTIRHDSIAGFLADSDSARRFMTIAANTWFTFYRELLDHGDAFLAEPELLNWLVFFAAQLGDMASVARFLERMGRLTLRTAAPRRLVDSFRTLRRRCAEKPVPGIDVALARIARQQALLLYELGWMNESLEALGAVSTLDDALCLLKAELMCSCEHFRQGLGMVNALLDRWESLPEPPVEKVVLGQLVRIHGLRNDGAFAQCRLEYLDLLKSRPYQNPALDRAVLRYADIALSGDADSNLMMELLYEAVRLSDANPRDEAAARMALSQHLGHAGMLDEALEHLVRVDEIAGGTWFQRYTILNNKGVLAAKKGDTKQALAFFRECLHLVVERTDETIVRTNLMVGHCLSGDWGSAFVFAERVAQYVEAEEGESETRRCGAFNLHILYAHQGDRVSAQHFLDLARAVPCEVDEGYWQAKFDMASAESANVEDLYLTMMSNWYLSSAPFQSIQD